MPEMLLNKSACFFHLQCYNNICGICFVAALARVVYHGCSVKHIVSGLFVLRLGLTFKNCHLRR